MSRRLFHRQCVVSPAAASGFVRLAVCACRHSAAFRRRFGQRVDRAGRCPVGCPFDGEGGGAACVMCSSFH